MNATTSPRPLEAWSISPFASVDTRSGSGRCARRPLIAIDVATHPGVASPIPHGKRGNGSMSPGYDIR
jgi:hypothetical protein